MRRNLMAALLIASIPVVIDVPVIEIKAGPKMPELNVGISKIRKRSKGEKKRNKSARWR